MSNRDRQDRSWLIQAQLDEKLGRRVATELGLPVVGTMGILLRAKREGQIDLVQPVVDRMIACGGRIGPAAIADQPPHCWPRTPRV